MPTKKKNIKKKPVSKTKKKPIRKPTLKKPVSKQASPSLRGGRRPTPVRQRLSGGKQSPKRPAKKPTRKIVSPKKRAIKKRIHIGAGEKLVGEITHYFPKVRAGVIKLTNTLSIGDSVKIKGHTTDFTQKITSMQIDRTPLATAKKGSEIGLLVDNRVRRKDIVIKLGSPTAQAKN